MKAKTVVVVLCAIALLLAFAPAKVMSVPIKGGGDSEPIGPGPHAIVHAPGSFSKSTQYVTIWGHAHNMAEFEDYWVAQYRNPPQLLPCTITSRTVYAMGSTSWDIRYDVTISGSAGLVNGDVIVWAIDFLSLDDWSCNMGTATTNVTN